MANHDLSRHLFRPANHYTGVRMQQSRALLDSDINEGEMLDDEDRRAVVVDVIGPHGSADDGFKIANVDPITYDFDILAGSYYLGGLRHELASTQRYRAQSDWLQSSRGDAFPKPPAVPKGARNDLVYLVGWEQEVSATEDPEFREAALGGPDTSDRVRRMQRVYVRENTAEDCAEAFESLVVALTGTAHSFDRSTHELLSGARLTVGMDDPGDGDLCKPALAKGYTGVENQAIRVQIHDTGRFLWSYDNAAPLYRVTVSTDQKGYNVTFQTTPRDQAHFPTVGQVIELLPWGAELSSGAHVADHQIADHIGGGVLARVLSAYDPATRTVTVKPASSAKLQAMLTWLADQPEPRFFYARVWNPGDAGTGAKFGLAFQPGVPVLLKGTGLTVTISQHGIIGDYWIIGARPATPTTVVPWDLTRAPPHGPRRFYCPLSVIRWTMNPTGAVHPELDSCRRTFRPLTRQRRCCTVTVGDEQTSYGDFTSISAALAAIPVGVAGKICVLPGIYEERVVIQDRSDIVIEGCGERSIIRTPAANATSEGLVSIISSTNIALKGLRIEATGQFGIMVFGLGEEVLAWCRDVRLEDLTIVTTGDEDVGAVNFAQLWIPPTPAPFAMSTVAARLVDGLRVARCNLTMQGTISALANVFLIHCERSSLRDCKVTTEDVNWGGVHIGAACRDVTVEHNVIAGGRGAGITLGTPRTASLGPYDHTYYFDPSARLVFDEGTTEPGSGAAIPDQAPPPGGGADVDVINTAAISDIKIIGNTITEMGSSGISVLGFWSLETGIEGPYPSIETHQLVIADNLITFNFRYPSQDDYDDQYDFVVAFGGIVLADAELPRIHDNTVTQNGVYTARPTFGIYVLYGENIAVENNHVLDNGAVMDPFATPPAGISLMLAGRRVAVVRRAGYSVGPDSLRPAARVRGNVVHQPIGRALQVYGIGPLFIEGNSLVSEGFVTTSSFDAHCVDIVNIGISSELIDFGAIPSDLALMPGPPLTGDIGEIDELLIDGRILFTDNQVRFAPVEGLSSVGIATRIQSYGDIGVLDNQFLVTFPESGGTMAYDTSVIGWSVRVSNNRWEDPAVEGPPGTFQTNTSAATMAALNITALNQATRCIDVQVALSGPSVADNPVDDNQILTPCDEEDELLLLLMPPP